MKVERFTADWCRPCRAFAPKFNDLMDAYGLEAEVHDIDTEPGMARAREFGIKGIPAVVVDGVLVQDYTNLEDELRRRR